MPYIKPEERKVLDSYINDLASILNSKATFDATCLPGNLNYCITKLILKSIPKQKRYWIVALVSGVLHNVLDEFYRRYVAQYEDEKIAENGDVY